MADQLSESAARQLALKMRMEPRLRREMSVFFASVSKDMKSIYSAKGAVLDVSQFKDEVAVILRQHYRRVSKVFGNGLRQKINTSKSFGFKVYEAKQLDDEIDNAISEFINSVVPFRANEIIQTTQDDVNSAIASSLFLALGSDIGSSSASNEAIAASSQKEFNRKTRSRPQTIAVTETQTASEGSKEIEAERVAETAAQSANTTPSEVMSKEWVAVLDSRTRSAHVFADGQRVSIDEVFEVDGEELMFPGDESRGASVGNIINCRCIASYVVNDEPLVESVDTRIKPQTGAPNPTVEGIVGLDDRPDRKPFASVQSVNKPTPPTVFEKPTVPVEKAPEAIESVKLAIPKKPIKTISQSQNAVTVREQKINVGDRPPTLSKKKIKLTGDEDAYIEYYKGSGFFESNNVLRNKSAFSPREVSNAERMESSINSAISKSKVQSDGVLFRGVKSPELFDNAEQLIGKKIPIKTPQSTATDAGSGVSWSGLVRTSKGEYLTATQGQSVVFKINVKKGQSALNMEALSIGNTGEREFLLKSGGNYNVKDVRLLKDSNGKISGKVIEVDYDE